MNFLDLQGSQNSEVKRVDVDSLEDFDFFISPRDFVFNAT